MVLSTALSPEPNNFKMLKRTVQFSGLKNVLLFKLALSDKDGTENLSVSRHPSEHSIVLKRSKKVVKVSACRLDYLVKQGFIETLDLIKVDVEGAELKVLKGCEESIAIFKPIFSNVNHYPGEFKDVTYFMKEFNYKSYILSDRQTSHSIIMYPSYKKHLVKKLVAKTIYLQKIYSGKQL